MTRRTILWACSMFALACSHGTAMQAPPPTPLPEAGVSGPALSGHLEVHVVDDVTGEPITIQVSLTLDDGTQLEIPAGTTTLDDPRLVPPVSLEVALSRRSQRWMNVSGSIVVLGVAGERTGSIAGHVDIPSGAADEVTIRPLQPARLWRTTVFDRDDAMDCSQLDGCVYSMPALATVSGAVAVLREADVALGVALSRDVTHIDARAARSVTEIATIALPSPPAGLDSVVGVPGVVIGDHVALLGYTDDGHFAVPESGDAIWLLARAQSTTRESVVLQHGLHSLADAHAWPAWLDAPTISAASADGITVTAPSGASVLVVDWLSGMSSVASVLVLAPSGSIDVVPPETAIRANGARVRALDVMGVSSLSLDLATFDAHAQRYSDATLTFSP